MFGIFDKVYAQTVPADLQDPLGGQVTTLSNVFAFALNMLLGVTWAFVFVMGAIYFMKYMNTKGEPKEMANVQTTLMYLGIAAVALFFVTSFKTVIVTTLGLSGWDIPTITDFTN